MDDETKDILRDIKDATANIAHQLACLNDWLERYGAGLPTPVEKTGQHLVNMRRPSAADMAWARRIAEDLEAHPEMYEPVERGEQVMDEDQIADRVDDAFVDGQRAAWIEIVRAGLRYLNTDDPLVVAARREIDHAELRRVLRELWDEIATEPWPGDDALLSSILERFSDYLLE